MGEHRSEIMFITATLLASHFGVSAQTCSNYEPKRYTISEVCGRKVYSEPDREIIVMSNTNDDKAKGLYTCEAEFVMDTNASYACYRMYKAGCISIAQEQNNTWTKPVCVNRMENCSCLNVQSKSITVTLSTTEFRNSTVMTLFATDHKDWIPVTEMPHTTIYDDGDRNTEDKTEEDNTGMESKYYFIFLVVLVAIILIFILQVAQCRNSCTKLFKITQRRVAQLSRPSSSYDIPAVTVAISEDYYVHTRRGSSELPSYNDSQVSQETMACGIFFSASGAESNNKELILALPPPYPGPPSTSSPPPYTD